MLQPAANAEKSVCLNGSNLRQVMPLELLNDDWLWKLFEYLEPYDFFNLATISLRLKYFAVNNYKKCTNFTLTNALTSLTTFQYWMIGLGEFIEIITLNGNVFFGTYSMWKYFQLVLKCCTNLKSLRLLNFYCGDSPNIVEDLYIRSENFIAIELNLCRYGNFKQW